MNFLIITGELSGDLYAAKLVEYLKLLNPDAKMTGIGGKFLKKKVANFLIQTTHNNAIGYWEFFSKYRYFSKVQAQILNYVKHHPPDKIIIVDFQHFGPKLAKILKKMGFSVTIYISPNFWIYQDKKKARELVKNSDKIITIFKKEYDFYRNFSDNIFYFGHPLSTLIKQSAQKERLNKVPVIGIFPGSRPQEIKYLLPVMLKSLYLVKQSKKVQYKLVVADTNLLSTIKKHLVKAQDLKIEVISGSEKILQSFDLILCATGTTSLEAILNHKPVVVLGALSTFSYFLATKIFKIKLKYAALPNILVGKKVVPEFIQNELIPSKIASTIEDILKKLVIAAEQESILTAIKQEIYLNEQPLLDAAKCIL